VSWVRRALLLLTGFTAVMALSLILRGYRRWHTGWGAEPQERAAELPGDTDLEGAQFRATRAITIDAAAEQVWPWLMQVGRTRAGFYAYDHLDNGGTPSAREILPRYQSLGAGDLIAPMTTVADELTAFRIHRIEPNRLLLWEKPDSTWCWVLTPLPDGRTRLVTRLQVRYEWAEPLWAAGSMALLEVADFPMMRRMLRGIRDRAEAANRAEQQRALGPDVTPTATPGSTSAVSPAGAPGLTPVAAPDLRTDVRTAT
jgi:hypothetical protein